MIIKAQDMNCYSASSSTVTDSNMQKEATLNIKPCKHSLHSSTSIVVAFLLCSIEYILVLISQNDVGR